MASLTPPVYRVVLPSLLHAPVTCPSTTTVPRAAALALSQLDAETAVNGTRWRLDPEPVEAHTDADRVDGVLDHGAHLRTLWWHGTCTPVTVSGMSPDTIRRLVAECNGRSSVEDRPAGRHNCATFAAWGSCGGRGGT